MNGLGGNSMILRAAIAHLLEALALWRLPVSWMAALLLTIGAMARTRATMAFWPEFGSASILDLRFAVIVGAVVFSIFLGITMLVLERLGAPDVTHERGVNWAGFLPTLIASVVGVVGLGWLVILALGSLDPVYGADWNKLAAGLCDIAVLPGCVLAFAYINGHRDVAVAKSFLIAPSYIAAAVIVAFGILVERAVPQAKAGANMLPLLPSFFLSSLLTISMLLLALVTSRSIYPVERARDAFT